MKELASLGHLFVCVFLYYFSMSIVAPAITDVTMAALCPGTEQCGLAIYLSGFQQAITGLGTLVVTPIMGSLSDRCGRKAPLTVPMVVSIFPQAALAYSRTKTFFFIYYVLRTLSDIFCMGGMQSLPVAYVADMVGEQQRAAAISVLSGVSLAGFLSATLVCRFLPTALIFQVSATVAVFVTVYMTVFLVESSTFAVDADGSSQPILATTPSDAEARGDPERPSSNRGPPFWEMVGFLWSSLTISRAAVVTFLSGLADGGLGGSLLYFLKAEFHFSKDQFADLLMISGMAGVVSQLFLMPILVPAIGEEKLLSIALLASCTHMFVYGLAWASWVPYLVAIFVVFSSCSQPCIRSIVSKNVRSNEQGVAQGCISGLLSFANVLAPLAFTPLTALFLSESAPFHFPGFSLMCFGFVSMIAFIQSVIMTRPEPSVCSHRSKSVGDVQP